MEDRGGDRHPALLPFLKLSAVKNDQPGEWRHRLSQAEAVVAVHYGTDSYQYADILGLKAFMTETSDARAAEQLYRKAEAIFDASPSPDVETHLLFLSRWTGFLRENGRETEAQAYAEDMERLSTKTEPAP